LSQNRLVSKNRYPSLGGSRVQIPPPPLNRAWGDPIVHAFDQDSRDAPLCGAVGGFDWRLDRPGRKVTDTAEIECPTYRRIADDLFAAEEQRRGPRRDWRKGWRSGQRVRLRGMGAWTSITEALGQITEK
jgi:hypothetical protein